MNVCVIYDQCGERPLQFFIVKSKRSLRHLDGCYVNSTDKKSEANAEELDKLMDVIGNLKMRLEFPLGEARTQAIDEVITVGFLP